jgi:ABC-type transport system involved in cytochrome c biogenesis, permease component
MDITITIKVLMAVAAVLYLGSTGLIWAKKTTLGYVANIAGWVINLSVVIINFLHNGYVPFVSMYQVIVFLGLMFTLTAMYQRFVKKDTYTTPFFCLISGIVAIAPVAMDISVVWRFLPALQSHWFVPHVFAYMLSYSLCAVATVLGIVYYIDKKNRDVIEKGIISIVRVSIPFMTAGLFFGAIWANEVWSSFWSWDAKENWALVTWIFYALYLHIIRLPKWKKFANIFLFAGIIALFMAFLGVNIFGVAGSNHVYS